MKSVLVLMLLIAGTAGAKRSTVADMLKNIKNSAKGDNARIGNKSKTNLPRSADVFKKRRRKKLDYSKIKPPATSSFMQNVNTDRAELERITDKGIHSLFNLTQKFKRSPNRGELWLRLAELYTEKAQLVEYRIDRKFESDLKRFERKQISSRPKLNLKAARIHNEKAVQLYEWFIRDFPRDEKIPQALFFLGFNYIEIGHLEKGVKYYGRLTTRFPNNQYVSEANFAQAEYYFENERWKKAYKHYSAVVKDRNARLNGFAQYKSAWCLFRMGRYKLAFKRMVHLIREGRKRRQNDVAGLKEVNTFRIEQEALRDFVVFYAEAGNPADANGFFAELAGRPKHIKYVEKLGYFYSDKGRRDDVQVVFSGLVKENPTAPKAFEYKYQVVLNYAYSSKSRKFRQELYSWIKQFAPNSAWARANANNKELIANANKLREATLRNYVIQQHQTAQNSRAQYSQTLARQGYKLYLVEFSRSEHVPDMRFYYGELLYDLREYLKAAEEYLFVSRNTKSKYAKQSEINAVLSVEKVLPKESKLAKAIGNSTKPRPLPPTVKRFIKLAEWFRKKNPQHEKRTEITFKIARLYYLHNQFSAAEGYFFEIVEKHPKSSYTEFSANLILDGYNIRGDYKGLIVAAKRLLRTRTIAKSKVGRDIRIILENSGLKIAGEMESRKDYRASADEFARFAKENPNSKQASKAIFNAGINYERVGDLPTAAVFYERLLSRKLPASEAGLKRKSRVRLANLYQKSGRYEAAAKHFEFAAVENPRESAGYYYNAAVIYAGMRFYKSAISNYEKYYKKTKSKDRKEVHYEIAKLNLKCGKLSVAKSGYRDFINSKPSDREKLIEAQFRVAEIERSLRQRSQALKSYLKVGQLRRRYQVNSVESLKYDALGRLENINDRYRKFVKIKIRSASQQKLIQNKLKQMKSFNVDLKRVIDINSATGIIGSLVLLGKLNHHMFDSLRLIPAPKGLTKEELAVYSREVKKLYEPYRITATKSFKTAIKKSHDLHVYPEYLRTAFGRLKILEPGSSEYELSLTHKLNLIDWMGI